MKSQVNHFIILALASYISAMPIDQDLISITEPTTTVSNKENHKVQPPKITEMIIKSYIENRFAQTTLTSKVKNPAAEAQETTFVMVIPEQAFISSFLMEISGQNYTAFVEEKVKAKKTYNEAVSAATSAAHVTVSARDSNRFFVNINLGPESKATLYLTYEELLVRKKGIYELVLNINPKQLVKNLNVEVTISESRAITMIKTPPIRSGNKMLKENEKLDPRAFIAKPNPKQALIKFKPDHEKQKQIANTLGTKEDEGFAGQFVVQYDVENDPQGGEIIVKDGYFVHFFAPADLEPLPKYVVFVLDTSVSMDGKKIDQVKEALRSILGDLDTKDYFNIIEFGNVAHVSNLDVPEESISYPDDDNDLYIQNAVYKDKNTIRFPPAYPVTNSTTKKAINAINLMNAKGGTNIYHAISVGLHLIQVFVEKNIGDTNIQPLLIFLTDGDATVGITDKETIISKISEENSLKIPIISLAFGNDADRDLIQELSLNNYGFARYIYKDSDTYLQLENFYKDISSPLLKDVQFSYAPDVVSLTKTEFPIFFSGSEIVVTGKTLGNTMKDDTAVNSWGIRGPIILKPSVTKSIGQLERLWAYLTVKRFLAEREIAKNSTRAENRARELALKYSFVTPVTSLIVVKPDETNVVDIEEASIPEVLDYSLPYPFVHQAPIFPMTRPGNAYKQSTNPMLFTYEETDFDLNIQSELSTLTTNNHQTIPNRLKTMLPWLEEIIDMWDGSLTLFKYPYTLGFNETLLEDVECTDSLSNIGSCKLIKDCEIIYHKLVNERSLRNHFCEIKLDSRKLGGVCCPIQ